MAQLIVFEGIDGAGTTTQTRLVARALRLRGCAVLETSQPSGLEVGQLVRWLLGRVDDRPSMHALAMLFAADRLEHERRVIAPALARGEVVLCDRYTLSSLVYQGDELGLEYVARLNAQARLPDACFILDVDVEEAQRRLEARGDAPQIFDDIERQRRYAQRYRELCGRDFLVDGRLAPETITHSIMCSLGAMGVYR